jgi:SagB-type dehydrogenase family enzyme
MTFGVNQITLPQDVLDRVARVLDYHESTKLSHEQAHQNPHKLDPDNKPYEFRVFEMAPATSLPSGLLDVPAQTLALMEHGFASLPGGAPEPPVQDLKTLGTWLHFANGIASRKRLVTQTIFSRTCASDGHTFPCEIYIAAFGVDGLEPGLYHYTPREFLLRKLREGDETLARLTRGRPDLAFLKTVPLAMLVSTLFSRATWRFGKRGYRHAVHDAGYLVQNLVTVATALGIQTMTRLIQNDMATRELIGVRTDADFGEAEAVQALVVWADRALKPIAARTPARATSSATTSAEQNDAPGSVPAASASPRTALPPIDRPMLANETVPYFTIVSTHLDCVAPGVAVREVRPPLTDLSPLPPNFPTIDPPVMIGDRPPGEALRKILLTRAATTHFGHRPIARHDFYTINRLAFRGGTFFPLHPDGPHVALVRPFWIVHESGVDGFEPGIWYYHPPSDQWSHLRRGDFHKEAAYLAAEQQPFGRCAATCFCAANLHNLMQVAGPDVYRLAHLESGVVTNRVALSTEALNLSWHESGLLYDDELRQFLGLKQTGWEILNVIAVGHRVAEGAKE